MPRQLRKRRCRRQNNIGKAKPVVRNIARLLRDREYGKGAYYFEEPEMDSNYHNKEKMEIATKQLPEDKDICRSIFYKIGNPGGIGVDLILNKGTQNWLTSFWESDIYFSFFKQDVKFQSRYGEFYFRYYVCYTYPAYNTTIWGAKKETKRLCKRGRFINHEFFYPKLHLIPSFSFLVCGVALLDFQLVSKNK